MDADREAFLESQDMDELVENYLQIRHEVLRRIRGLVDECGGSVRFKDDEIVHGGSVDEDERFDILGVDRAEDEENQVLIMAVTEDSELRDNRDSFLNPTYFHIGVLGEIYDTISLRRSKT